VRFLFILRKYAAIGYGFRANRTYSHALIQFVEEITAIEQHKYAVGILLEGI